MQCRARRPRVYPRALFIGSAENNSALHESVLDEDYGIHSLAFCVTSVLVSFIPGRKCPDESNCLHLPCNAGAGAQPGTLDDILQNPVGRLINIRRFGSGTTH